MLQYYIAVIWPIVVVPLCVLMLLRLCSGAALEPCEKCCALQLTSSQHHNLSLPGGRFLSMLHELCCKLNIIKSIKVHAGSRLCSKRRQPADVSTSDA